MKGLTLPFSSGLARTGLAFFALPSSFLSGAAGRFCPPLCPLPPAAICPRVAEVP